MRNWFREIFSLKDIKGTAVFGILLVICWLTYSNSLHNPFMLDDHAVFSDAKLKDMKFVLNSFFYSPRGSGHGETFFGSDLYYRPMAYVAPMFSHMAFGNQPFGYHLLDLFLFTLMCFMLFIFIDLLFKDKVLALVTAILFAVHPINVFFVNYNASGLHSLRFIFMFLSVILFLKALGEGPKYLLWGVSLFCFLVALMCHEISLVLPFYILIVSVYVSQNAFARAVFRTWPYFLVLLGYLIFRLWIIPVPQYLAASLADVHPQETVALIVTFSKVIFSYISKLLFPDVITFAWNVLMTMNFIWLAGLGSLFIGWYLLGKANGKSISFFCATWLMLGFLPLTAASMIDPAKGLVIEPQWLTFSSTGFFLFIAYAGLGSYRRLNKWVTGLLFILLLIIWISITRYNNWIWGDEIRYFDYRVGTFDGVTHLDYTLLGDLYRDRNKPLLAENYYRKAVGQDPPLFAADAYNNLGVMDMDRGFYHRAQEEFLASIKLDPYLYSSLNNLASVYFRQKDYKSAKSILFRVLEINKYSLEARFNLALIFEEESNFKEAESLYIENLSIVPYEDKSLLGLVGDSIRLNDTVNTKKYSQWLIEHSRDPVILTDLGIILGNTGQLPIAFDAYSQAIRVDPNYKDAYLLIGNTLASAKMYSKAIHIWQIGETIDPKDQRFRKNIAKAIVLITDSR